jgi:hypothetical protein
MVGGNDACWLRMQEPLLELLDDRRLGGVHGVRRLLGPERRVSIVAMDDMGMAEEAITHDCQCWGGFGDLLVPMTSAATSLAEPWASLVRRLDVELIETNGTIEQDELERNGVLVMEGSGIHDPLLVALLATGVKRDDARTVRVPRLSDTDPWMVAYLGCLGTWPDRPQDRLLERLQFRPDLEWDELIPTAFDEEVSGCAEDLLARLRDVEALTPARVTAMLLQVNAAPRHTSIVTGEPTLPEPHRLRQMLGPNIIVIYEPGSVEDLCLLWWLRADHGMPEGLPLAAPTTEDIDSVIDLWQEEFVQARFGIGGDRRSALVSCSVPLSQLEELVATRSNEWRALEFSQVLGEPQRPARGSSDLISFVRGSGRVATWGPTDQDHLTRGPGVKRLDLQSTIQLQSRILPPSETLRPESSMIGGHAGGGARRPARDPNTIIEIRWPTGWQVLEGVLADHGLRARASEPGQAAAALLRTLGSVPDIAPLLSMSVLDEMHRLSERRGMAWFRERARGLAHAAATGGGTDAEERLRAVESRLEALSVRPADEDAHDLTLERLRQVLLGNREVAKAWLRWAEARDLLIRGAEVWCPRCRHRSWRPINELTPPVICRGCGRRIAHPFPEGELRFRYRAGEPLLRAVEADAISHLLAMRWWCQLLNTRSDRPAFVYGAYPGIELTERDSGKSLPEVDVLLILYDGALVVGECKRRGAGLRDRDLENLDRVAQRLDARWSFIATSSWAADCPDIWREAERRLPDPQPRYVLTAEHLLQLDLLRPAGVDIYAWHEANSAEQISREREFVDGVDLYLEWLTEDEPE